ncbi:MAG: LPS export ABC transporter periplasmic protein LptC [Gemmatimonadaceae bacterium]|jgi:LPS export ABC transporter protein LptC|nr:LPS export ABC transporter periplasmic protein LptC [Gemmatimonadaceae bacterium]
MTMRSARRLLGATLAAAAVAACGGDAARPVTSSATTVDSADQVMFKLRTVLTDEGVLRARLESDSGFFFDENTRIELRGVRTVFFSRTGAQDAVLTSREGTYNTRGGVMEARKRVEVVTTDGKRLTTPFLRFEQYRNMVVSDSPFVLVQADRRLEGVGFESDPQMLNIRVKKFGRSSGGSVVLPAGRGGEGMILRADTTRSAPAPTPSMPPTSPTAGGIPPIPPPGATR